MGIPLTLPIVNTNQESQQMPWEEPKYMKYQDAESLKTELMGDFFDSNDPAESREIAYKLIARKSINKVPSPCPAEMYRKIPSRAVEQEEEKRAQIQDCLNMLDWSNSFREEEEIQNENLFRDKTSGRKKITKDSLERKGAEREEERRTNQVLKMGAARPQQFHHGCKEEQKKEQEGVKGEKETLLQDTTVYVAKHIGRSLNL
ncbi:uncharacterized protein LOC143927118 [Lithobates pipiens]